MTTLVCVVVFNIINIIRCRNLCPLTRTDNSFVIVVVVGAVATDAVDMKTVGGDLRAVLLCFYAAVRLRLQSFVVVLLNSFIFMQSYAA